MTVLSRCLSTSARLAVLSLGVILAHTVMSLGRLDSDVLVEELFGSEIVHEVLGSDETTLLVTIFDQDLVKSLNHSLHHLHETEVHSLFIFAILANILVKLLVNLLDDAVEPVFDVGIGQFNFFSHLGGLVVQFLGSLDLDVKLMDLWVS